MRPASLNAIASLALIAGLAGPAQALVPPAPPDTTISKEMLADGIYLFRAPSDLDKWTATNAVVIVNDNDVTVFDSNSRLSTARAIIAEIKRITPKPVRTVINSHWHLDHWSGNDEYVKAFPGVQIIATTQTRDYMKRMPGKFYAYGLNNTVTRSRAALDSAIRTGKTSDGKALTVEERRKRETDIKETADFAAEVTATPRVLPTMAYRDSLVLYNGKRDTSLVRSSAAWDPAARRLAVTMPDGSLVEGEAATDGAALVEVYGRLVRGRVVLGPWADAFSDLVGRSLTLVEREDGAWATDSRPATLVSRASLGIVDGDGRRFRMLFELDGLDALGEEAWGSRRVQVGEVTLLVGRPTPRCAVPSASPDTGVRDRDVLRELIEKRGPVEGEPCLGVYAEVLEPGTVRVGDAVEPL